MTLLPVDVKVLSGCDKCFLYPFLLISFILFLPASILKNFLTLDFRIAFVNGNMLMNECEHYRRRCLLVADCCNKVYPCRFCHDKNEQHSLDRTTVQELVCIQCQMRQCIASHCISCGIKFGMYTCLTCRIFDDADKKQFHCLSCGTCRTGGKDNFFHCNECGICLSKSMQESHTCIPYADNCPLCNESIQGGIEPSFVPDCGHFIHLTCYKAMKKRKCPICKKKYDLLTKTSMCSVG